MENPAALTNFGDDKDLLADLLSKDWGITFNNDVVDDLNSPQPTTAASAYYDANHSITVNMNNIVSFYPFTRSLTAAETGQGLVLTLLVETNERSWGETDFASISQGGQVTLNENEVLGPLTLAVAGENPNTKGRVVVFGTSEFAVYQILTGMAMAICSSIRWIGRPSHQLGRRDSVVDALLVR